MPKLRCEATDTIQDNPNWRRHKGACVHYRERWSGPEEPGDDGCRLLYQIVCLMGTPPLTADEQIRCMSAARACWRRPSPMSVPDDDPCEADARPAGSANARERPVAQPIS
ncbi:MAG TPA: hypothetical protein VFC51_12690 [Chloroflexota bacterium]|nr:hypothetical protein [Chloroflexota bacterium]